MGFHFVSYSAMKGRAAQVAPPVSNRQPETLSPAEEARIADNRDLVLEHMPEMLQIIRNLHAEGLIDGWRNIKQVRLLDEAENA